MKVTIVIIALLSVGILLSQDLNCLNYDLYDSYYDAVQIKNPTDLTKGVSESQLDSIPLQLVVNLNSYLEFPKWTRHNRNGIDRGFEVILRNNSLNSYSLANIDGRIIIIRQVYYDNEWKFVKSFTKTPFRRCGNSYLIKKVIEAGDHFTFIAPCLKGNIKVKFRFVIVTKPVTQNSAIYSNEFDGFINKKLIE